MTPDYIRPEDHIRATSRPSALRITDMRTATVGWDGWRFPIVRIDTNQGLSGYGEVRDGGCKEYALLLKSRLLGENPCDVARLYRTIRQFGHHGRQGGGVSGVEMALLDLAGKAYGAPAYQLCGGRFRDAIRMYCDTPAAETGEALGQRLLERRRRGFTMLKMDVGIQPLIGIPGMLAYPAGMLGVADGTPRERALDPGGIMHPFSFVRLTERGIAAICERVAAARAVVGDDIPIAADHFGHIGIDDCIRLGRALEPFHLAWLEDLVPWQYTDQWEQLARALETPVCTGEDIFGYDGFAPLLQRRAVDIIHPDLATSGGILETQRIGDAAQRQGIAMALHMAGTPISTFASVHCAAATENFIALEHHFSDVPFWDAFVDDGAPIIRDGFIAVPETPGLGIRVNEEALAAHLVADDPLLFAPTPEWDAPRSWDRLWS